MKFVDSALEKSTQVNKSRLHAGHIKTRLKQTEKASQPQYDETWQSR